MLNSLTFRPSDLHPELGLQLPNYSMKFEVNSNYSFAKSKGCGEWYIENRNSRERITYYCKSGRCSRPECQDAWSSRKLGVCYGLVTKYDFKCMFSLTLNPKFTGLMEAWDNMQVYWAKFRKRMNRYLKSLGYAKFNFFCVLEEQSGKRKTDSREATHMPHIHGFCDVMLDEREVLRHWCEATGGTCEKRRPDRDDYYYWVTSGASQVKVKPVEDREKAAFYVSKYCTKDEMVNGLQWCKKRTKTFWRSSGLRTEPEYKKWLDRQTEAMYIALSRVPVPESEWMLIKECSYAETQRERQDVARTCEALSREGIEASKRKVETQANQRSGSQETFGFTFAT